MAIADQSILEHLEPIFRLSAGRKKEIAALCFTEKVNKDINPMRMNVAKSAQALYLIKGDLELSYLGNKKAILRGGSAAAKYSIKADDSITDAIALTDIEILRIDNDLLDILMTWDQLSNAGSSLKAPITNTPEQPTTEKPARTTGDWMNDTEVFSAVNLQSGVFSQLPESNIEEMFKRMTSFSVTAGQMVIQQGGEGDYYYLIQKGVAEVSRVIDANQPATILAELKEGSGFGEEALVSDIKRNATVIMKTDGELLRLNKKDFIEILKAPLINQISMEEAQNKIAAGAAWLDVRLPSEYKHDHIKGAINLPLSDIRQISGNIDKSKEYVLYCQTGRRSSVAAFVLAQSGMKVYVLEGGTGQSKK
jgi:rhodanese-related sulfurtransferase